ncbi:MAG: hypothetical protein JPMHGGIA_01833 [Saprospiraceae bacterium]|nr:hypothetical protein [Saprospiraceae bacterium]
MKLDAFLSLRKSITLAIIGGSVGIVIPIGLLIFKQTTFHLYAWLIWSVSIFVLSMNILLKLIRLNAEIQTISTQHQINEIKEHIDKSQRVMTQYCNEIKEKLKDSTPQTDTWTEKRKQELLSKLIENNFLDDYSRKLIVNFLTETIK